MKNHVFLEKTKRKELSKDSAEFRSLHIYTTVSTNDSSKNQASLILSCRGGLGEAPYNPPRHLPHRDARMR